MTAKEDIHKFWKKVEFNRFKQNTVAAVDPMENKVVVITGSSSGIGAKTAIAFAKEGAILVIHGTNSLRLNSVANECEQASPSNYRVS